MTRREFPPPPIEHFKHGAVWDVRLEEFGANASRNDYQDLIREREVYKMFVLLTSPWKEWPANKDYYWRSRLIVGDRKHRKEEDIFADFRRLLLQTPPVLRNWRKTLPTGIFQRRSYHIVWLSQVKLITV